MFDKETIYFIAKFLLLMSMIIFLPIAIMIYDTEKEKVVEQPGQPFEHAYSIVIKEKYIAYVGAFPKFVLRYYNCSLNEHYIMESKDAFVRFDIGEPLILWEKYDGQKLESNITRAGAEVKAEEF